MFSMLWRRKTNHGLLKYQTQWNIQNMTIEGILVYDSMKEKKNVLLGMHVNLVDTIFDL